MICDDCRQVTANIHAHRVYGYCPTPHRRDRRPPRSTDVNPALLALFTRTPARQS